MHTRFSITMATVAVLVVLAHSAFAQLATPNASGAAIGLIQINASDVAAQSRFWANLGGTIVEREQITMAQFPGIYVWLQQQASTGGSVGSTINHVGFYVRDFDAAVARWKAAGLNWEPVTNPSVGQGFLMGPDSVRVEIYEDKSISTPMQMHHIHMMVPNPADAQTWYVQHFGAVAGTRRGGVGLVRSQFATVNVPGTEITLSKSDVPQMPTKGRSVDHIGFEVTDIDVFVARLTAGGVKTDGEVRNSAHASGLRSVYITDPWGTEIEITQGLAAPPAAGR